MKIHQNDTVKVLLGKDAGRQGKVIRVLPKKKQVVVEGINIFKKHIKPMQNQPGSILQKERPLAVSKVALVCPSCKKATRVGYKTDKSGQKYRVCKKCQAVINSQK